MSENIFFRDIQNDLSNLQAKKLIRNLEECQISGKFINFNNEKLISFASNDYLGLSQDPLLKKYASKTIDEYGVGSGSSRYISGNHLFYNALERQLARFKGMDKSLIFGSGYLTNIGVIQALLNHNDIIILDKHAHNSLFSGAKLSKATIKIFPHNDIEALKKILCRYRTQFRHCLVITEGIFSMDGDKPPLDDIINISINNNSFILIDDAHALGVINQGYGSKVSIPDKKNIIFTGTLSKALGAYGGYVCADEKIIDIIKQRSHALIYSTALPPVILASAIAALEIIEKNPKLADKLMKRSLLFCECMNLTHKPQSAIIPVIVKSEEAVIQLAKKMRDNGYYVPSIRPPTVPKGSSRLRFSFSLLHDEEEIITCAKILKNYL